MLQFLQWQKKQRGLKATHWVLKSPAHLGYLDLLRSQFPDLHIVHMHRDPRTTIASGASLNATLHAMHADTVDVDRVGAQWLQRMGWTNDRAMAVRDGWVDDSVRVTDIAFDDAVADPIGQVSRVYDAIGLPFTAEAESAMRRWLDDRPREAARPPYGLQTYGLRPEQVDERFTLYNKRFGQYVGK
jgi:Sulfotransferase family